MSIATSCRVIQVLEPDANPPYTITELDQNSLAVNEGGALYLPVDQLVAPILFSQEKLSADYDIVEHDITNETDVNPLEITYNFTDRTIEGFTLVLDSAPDTVFYRFRWRTTVTEI